MLRATAERLVEGNEVMPVARRGVPVSVRVPPELAKRLDELVAKHAKDRGIAALGITTEAVVVKPALLRDVEALEAECK